MFSELMHFTSRTLSFVISSIQPNICTRILNTDRSEDIFMANGLYFEETLHIIQELPD